MRKKLFLYVCLFCLSALNSWAQTESRLLQDIEKETDESKKASMRYQLGSLYHAQQGYKKALAYFKLALEKTNSKDQAQAIKQKMLQAYASLGQYDEAITTGEALLAEAQMAGKESLRLQTLNALAYHAEQKKDYAMAQKYTQELWKAYKEKNDIRGKAVASNNLGVIYRKQNNLPESEKWFNESIKLNERILQTETNTLERTLTYINIGVTYTKLEQIELANQNFTQALDAAGANPKAQATALNYSAMGRYLNDDNAEAIRLASDAKQVATENQDSENVIYACEILKRIYEAQNADKEAKEYADLAAKEQQKLDAQRTKERKNLADKELAIEQKESEIQNAIAENNKREAKITQERLEKEKQAKEIENQRQKLILLEQDKALAYAKIKEQEGEQIRTKQLLALAEQKAETERQKAETDKQKSEVDKQKLLVDKEKAENEIKTKDLKAKERDLQYANEQKKAQEAKLRQEQIIRYLGIGLLLLVLAILVFVYRSLRLTRKLNTKIQNQVVQIQEQKEKEKALERDFAEARLKHEKDRIARDLHDNIGGQLTYLAKTLASADKKFNNVVDKTISELRNTVWAVQQSEITAPELEDKIYNLIAKIDIEADIQVDFRLPESLMFSSQEGLNTFRIIQEALQNAVKYSQATLIKITAFQTQEKKMTLQIIDNGKGFDVEEANRKKDHYGLLNMQARAELMNAYFEISSQVGKGTIIQVVINLHTV